MIRTDHSQKEFLWGLAPFSNPPCDWQIALGQPDGTPELARRQASGSWPSGQASPRPVPRSAGLSWPSPRRCTATLPPWKPIFPLVLPSGGRCGLRHDYAPRRRAAARHRKAFARWLQFQPSDRSAQRSCPHLAKPSQGWARARAMKALLSFAIRHPEPNGSRWPTPPSLIQQRPGQSRGRDPSLTDAGARIRRSLWPGRSLSLRGLRGLRDVQTPFTRAVRRI